MYVVSICLTIFCKDIFAVHIGFELDNQTAVSYLNHMGVVNQLGMGPF